MLWERVVLVIFDGETGIYRARFDELEGEGDTVEDALRDLADYIEANK